MPTIMTMPTDQRKLLTSQYEYTSILRAKAIKVHWAIPFNSHTPPMDG